MIITKRYNRENAVAYAKRWALDRNPLFTDFTGRGGDCTSFVSQAVLAGSCTMDYNEPFGWYYVSDTDRAPAWSGVEFFYNYITGSGDFPPNADRQGPYGREVPTSRAQVGDVIQLARAGDFYHSMIITGFDGNDILISAHSDNALDRRISTYTFNEMRVIHIDGVRVQIVEDECFQALIDGIAIP